MVGLTLVVQLSSILGFPAAILGSDSPGPSLIRYWDAVVPGASAGFIVVLDPGHDPPEPGALSCTGIHEVVFNDALTRRIAILLASHKNIKAFVSRRPHEILRLKDRAERIASLAPDLAVSIHHDSVKPQFIRYHQRDGIEVPVCDAFAGYSLFAQAKGRPGESSQRFARTLARTFQRLGLRRTTYHATKIPGENRPWIDSNLGIHAGDYLFLLRKLDTPVVLVEFGFLVNPEEERHLRDPDHVFALARAVTEAIIAHAAQDEG